MTEQVQTGGMMQFHYGRQREAELDPVRRNAIQIGYAEADERKRKEKKNRIIFWIIATLVVLLILGYVLLKK